MAVNDILAKYRGSLLGPFWITLSTGAFVAGIGVVYADLMHVSAVKYVPWMATGIIIWNLISQMITDGGDAFLAGSQIIKQTAVPLPLFVWRVVLRNLLNFAHQLVVIVVVAVWFNYLVKINVPMAILGLALLVLNVSWVTFFAAIISARFRDFQQVNVTILQLMFFISPVIWIPKDMVGSRYVLLEFNPFDHLLTVVRNPLLGLPVPSLSLIVLVALALFGWLFTFGFYAAVRRRIVHYL